MEGPQLGYVPHLGETPHRHVVRVIRQVAGAIIRNRRQWGSGRRGGDRMGLLQTRQPRAQLVVVGVGDLAPPLAVVKIVVSRDLHAKPVNLLTGFRNR